MLSLYRPPRGSDLSSEEETVIPAGTPYLTKAKGQLVMARHKKDTKVRAVTIKGVRGTSAKALDLTRSREAAVDFLGEAFGVRARTPRARTQSLEIPSTTHSTAAVFSYAAPQPLAYSTPLPQQGFSTMPSFLPMSALHQPTRYAVAPSHLTHQDLEQLTRIDAHYRSISGGSPLKVNPTTLSGQGLDSKLAAPLVKHTCANCGRLRSKRYYAEHPIKPGEIPVQEFCAKCQRDASSTSSSRSSDNRSGRAKNSKKKRSKIHKRSKETAKHDASDDDSLESQEPMVRKRRQPKESKRGPDHTSAQSKNQRSGYKEQKESSRSNTDSDEESARYLRANPYGSSRDERQSRGRFNLRADMSKFPVKTSSESPSSRESHRTGSDYEHYEISRILKSRREQKTDFDPESAVPVYQYIGPNQSRSDNRYKTYERGSSLQRKEEEPSRGRPIFSRYDEISDESSLRETFRGSREDGFENHSSLSQEFDQRPRHGHSGRDERMSFHHRRDIFYSQSGEALSRTPRGGVLQRGGINRYHGEKFSPPPAEHYTHYYSDWSVVSASQATPNVGQRKEHSQQSKGYRRDLYDDSELYSSQDETRCTKSSTPSSSISPPAPTPPPLRHRTWSFRQQRGVNVDDRARYSDPNDTRSAYQKAYGVGSVGTRDGRKYFPEDLRDLDPFYSAINAVINGERSELENMSEVEPMKRVTFRNAPVIE